MSADFAGLGFPLKRWCECLRTRPLRQVLAGAVSSVCLLGGTLQAQQNDGFLSPAQRAVQPAQMQTLQLEDSSV